MMTNHGFQRLFTGQNYKNILNYKIIVSTFWPITLRFIILSPPHDCPNNSGPCRSTSVLSSRRLPSCAARQSAPTPPLWAGTSRSRFHPRASRVPGCATLILYKGEDLLPVPEWLQAVSARAYCKSTGSKSSLLRCSSRIQCAGRRRPSYRSMTMLN